MTPSSIKALNHLKGNRHEKSWLPAYRWGIRGNWTNVKTQKKTQTDGWSWWCSGTRFCALGNAKVQSDFHGGQLAKPSPIKKKYIPHWLCVSQSIMSKVDPSFPHRQDGVVPCQYSLSRWGGPRGWATAWRSKEFHNGLQNKNRILHNVRRVMVQGIRVMQNRESKDLTASKAHCTLCRCCTNSGSNKLTRLRGRCGIKCPPVSWGSVGRCICSSRARLWVIAVQSL